MIPSFSYSYLKAIECGLVRQRAQLFEKKIEQNRIIKEEIYSGTTLRKTPKDPNLPNPHVENKDKKDEINTVLKKTHDDTKSALRSLPLYRKTFSQLNDVKSFVNSPGNHHEPKGKTKTSSTLNGLLTTCQQPPQQNERPASLFLPKRKPTTVDNKEIGNIFVKDKYENTNSSCRSEPIEDKVLKRGISGGEGGLPIHANQSFESVKPQLTNIDIKSEYPNKGYVLYKI